MDKSTLERWEEKIVIEGDCWIWIGAVSGRGYKEGKGYPKLLIGSRKDGSRKIAGAHRLSYEHFIGKIPDGYQLDHVLSRGCTSTRCVNPLHLEPVTNAENTRRGKRGRLVTKCVHGHLYNEENTLIRRNGRRACRACARERMKTMRENGYIVPSRRK